MVVEIDRKARKGYDVESNRGWKERRNRKGKGKIKEICPKNGLKRNSYNS